MKKQNEYIWDWILQFDVVFLLKLFILIDMQEKKVHNYYYMIESWTFF